MRIGLFVTCLTDTLFPSTGQAVVAVLERLGGGPRGRTSGFRGRSLQANTVRKFTGALLS